MAVTAPIKPISERERPSLCIQRVSTEPCNTHGKPLEKPKISTVIKRRSNRGLSVEIKEDMAAILQVQDLNLTESAMGYTLAE
jgi:hypothetical protein